MLRIGLTGGIGSGKTMVSEIFEKLGIPVYIADIRAKELMLSEDLMSKIQETFGEESYINNELNRAHLAERVFSNKEELTKLNSIVHPAVRKDFLKWHDKQKSPYTIREAAILFESGANKDCDKVISISAPKEIRIKRVMKRDSVEEESVISRMNNQWTDEERNNKSDFIINNDGIEMLLPQVLKIHDQLKKMNET